MGEPSELGWEAIEAMNGEARIELIQALIPKTSYLFRN